MNTVVNLSTNSDLDLTVPAGCDIKVTPAGALYVNIKITQNVNPVQTFYIDPISGVDSGTGSLISPWKTPGYAFTNATPGSMVILQGGIYRVAGTTTFGPAGTSIAQMTTYKAAPGARVIFSQANDHPPDIAMKDYMVLDGIWFGGLPGLNGTESINLGGTASVPGTHKYLKNCTIFGYPQAVNSGTSEYYVYQSNRFVSNGATTASHALYLAGGNGSGTAQSNHSIVDDNIFVGAQGYGIYAWNTSRSCIVTRNLVTGHWYGLGIDGSDHLVANNTFYKEAGGTSTASFGAWLHGNKTLYMNNINSTVGQISANDGANNVLQNNANLAAQTIQGINPIVITAGQEATQIGQTVAVMDAAIAGLKTSFSKPIATIYADQTIAARFTTLKVVMPIASPLYARGLNWAGYGQANVGTDTPAPATPYDFWTAFKNLGLKDWDKNGIAS